MDPLALKVPVGLDAPRKMFLWDMDVFMITIMGIGLGILTRNLLVWPGIALFLSWRWGKFKSGKHPWFFLHAMYWFAPLPETNPRVPGAALREYLR